MDEAEEQAFISDPWASSLQRDQVLAVMHVDAAFVYHAMCSLDGGQRKQHTFWQAVFGAECMRGNLHYFKVVDMIVFKQPQTLPVVDRRRLKSFFTNLDLFSPQDLVEQLTKDMDGSPLPDWVDKGCHLVVRLPGAHAYLVARRTWTSFSLPDPKPEQLFSVGVRQRARLMGWSHIPDLTDEFSMPDNLEGLCDLQMSGHLAAEFATTVRELWRRLDSKAAGDRSLLESCHRAAHMLQRMSDELDVVSMNNKVLQGKGRVSTSRLAYQSTFMIQCILLSSHLRDAAEIREVLVRAVDMCLPKVFSEAVHGSLAGDNFGLGLRTPSPGTISRARFSVDAALMLRRQQINRKAEEEGGVIRYIMIDASVQGHFDFELVRVTTIHKDACGDLFLDALETSELWDAYLESLDEEDMRKTQEREAELQALMWTRMDIHLPPAVVLGSGHGKLYHKLHAAMRCFYLDTGTALALQKFCQSIFAFCTDQGTEAGLHQIPPVLVRKVLPWIAYQGVNAADEHDLAPPVELGEDRLASIDLRESVGIAGLLHIIHNSTEDLGRSMVTFDELMKQLSHVSKLLCRKDSRARLLQTCFADRIGRHLQSDIKGFKAKLNTDRWGSIGHCVVELLKIERSLRFCWDVTKYGGQPAARDENNTYGVDVTLIDSALTSPVFWARLHMLECLAKVINGCLTWVESCPCHGDLPENEFPHNVKKTWASCPLRGCRAPELACGEFETFLRNLSATSASELLACLPRDISREDRAGILQEFERGRAHLVFVFNLRLGHWKQQPYCVFACAHLNKDVSKTALEQCLALPAQTSLVAKLQEPPLREQAEAYVNGEDLTTLPCLLQFLGMLRYCPVAERAVEGDHAQVRLDESATCVLLCFVLTTSHCCIVVRSFGCP